MLKLRILFPFYGWNMRMGVQLIYQAERADISELSIAKGLEEKYIYEAH